MSQTARCVKPYRGAECRGWLRFTTDRMGRTLSFCAHCDDGEPRRAPSTVCAPSPRPDASATYTPEQRATILAASFLLGIDRAADAHGMPRSTLRNWRRH